MRLSNGLFLGFRLNMRGDREQILRVSVEYEAPDESHLRVSVEYEVRDLYSNHLGFRLNMRIDQS